MVRNWDRTRDADASNNTNYVEEIFFEGDVRRKLEVNKPSSRYSDELCSGPEGFVHNPQQ